MFKNYIVRLYVGLALLFAVIIGVNIIIDPYALFNYVSLPGWNQEKPALVNNLRAFHMRELARIKPQALILGSSRAQLGLNAAHSGFAYPAYNLGMPLATIDEMADYFTYANQLAPVKQAIIAIDFFSFNAYLKSASPFKSNTKADAFNTNDKIAALIGYSGLKGSIETLQYNRRQQSYAQLIKTHPDVAASQSKAKVRFDKSEQFYVERKIYLPYPYKDYALVHSKNSTKSLAFYQKILATCEERQIECHVMILPVHARQLELIHRLGLWEKFEAWKRAVVALTAQFSSNIPLYDFTGYEKIQTEAVPSLEASNQKMHYFIDSAHITDQLGNDILDWILLNKPMPEPLGQKITLQNIDEHLRLITLQREAFLQGGLRIIAKSPRAS